MRVLVLSDIHANLEALNAVLDDAGPFDVLWSLGDVVGYGPEPEACITAIRSFEHASIPGNHDWGVLGRLDLADFNADARQANLWTRDQLSAESRRYLEDLPETQIIGEFTLAHGSPRYPIWEYILYPSTAALNLPYFETAICLVGHTHVPILFTATEDRSAEASALEPDLTISLQGGRYILNPGSVGQPRDGDPRASYVILDTDTCSCELRRVPYTIARTQERMRELGLPTRLVRRLELGW